MLLLLRKENGGCEERGKIAVRNFYVKSVSAPLTLAARESVQRRAVTRTSAGGKSWAFDLYFHITPFAVVPFVGRVISKGILRVEFCRYLRIDRLQLLKLFDRIDAPARFVGHLPQFARSRFV